MQKHLFYVPVERYAGRWTEYVSGPDGMFAACAHEAGLSLTVIAPHSDVLTIKSGPVLDTTTRAKFAFAQMSMLLEEIQRGHITSESVIYFEDFWTPGFETLPYLCQLAGIRPKVYAFCHAQSVDPHDFTYPMRDWMRYLEQGWAKWLTGIFVADPALRDMLVAGGVCGVEKIHAVGTVMHRSSLLKYMEKDGEYPSANVYTSRLKTVLFTSRLDDEKNPRFFLDLASQCSQQASFTDVKFSILSGREVPAYWREAASAEGVGVYDILSRAEYLRRLCTSAVVVNCADQDFVGYCQLDALACGCSVLCPDYLTFPGMLQNTQQFLYAHHDLDSCMQKLRALLPLALSIPPLTDGNSCPGLYKRFGAKYESSVARMVHVMFAPPSLEAELAKGEFDV